MADPRDAGQQRPSPPDVILDGSGVRLEIGRIGAELSNSHGDDSLVIGVLKGATTFTADLVRRLEFNPALDFVAMSSFDGGGQVRLTKDLSTDIAGLEVIVVQDVVDTGLSLNWLTGELRSRHPRSITVCALVDKPHRRIVPVQLDHVGISVDADFVIGYGLDFAGRYRNLDLLATAELERLSADPDSYVSWAYENRVGRGEGRTTAG